MLDDAMALEIPLQIASAVKGKLLYGTHKGDLTIILRTGLQLRIIGATFVPGLETNLLSTKQLGESGYTITFDESGCTMSHKRDGK